MEHQTVFERYEIKYLLDSRQRDAVLRAMEPYMAPDQYGRSLVRNVYYDTPDYRLIRASLDRPVYKEKLRVRSYDAAGADDPVFVELKKKYREVVYKRRILLPRAGAEAALAGAVPLPDSQIGREIAYALELYRGLRPAVFLAYERQAYAARDGSGLRITFDEDIRYRCTGLSLGEDSAGKPLLAPGRVLLEVKTGGSMPLWLARALAQQAVYKTSYSKYGAAYQNMNRTEQGVCRNA